MKKKFVIGIFIFNFVLLAIGFFYNEKFFQDSIDFKAYFLNSSQNMIECENRKIILDNCYDKKYVLEQGVKILFGPPLSKNLISFDLANLELKNINFDSQKKLAELDFSREYYKLENEIFFRSSLVWSLTSLDFIDGVKILVDGKKLKKTDGDNFDFFSRENILLNPDISDEKTYRKMFKLYFKKDDKLFIEEREIDIALNQPQEKYIVEQVILGPENSDLNLINPVPKETKIYDIKTDKDICYISLSGDFIKKCSRENQKFAIYAIVNSLTELENINKVQFLIETGKINKKDWNFDLSNPFERNEKIVGNE